jgi:hypothetical protein
MKTKMIFKDVRAETSFLNGVETARDRALELIDIFNSMQDWERIDSLETFISLVTDPELYYDRVLIRNLNAKDIGNAKPNPDYLARMYDIPRQSYINMIRGVFIEDPGCEPCHKVKKIRKGKPVIAMYEFERYREFLLFSSGSFTVNEDAIAEHSKSFETWATTADQLERVDHWESMIKMLNTHSELYPFSSVAKQAIAKGLGLQLSEAISGSFMIDPETLKNLILKR